MRKSLMWKRDWNSWCHDAKLRTDILWCLTQFGKLIGLMAQTSTQGCRRFVCHIFRGLMPSNYFVREHTLRGNWIPSEQVLCMEVGFCDEEKLDVEERLKQLVPWCKIENWHPLMLNSIWKADRADGTNKYTRLQTFCLPHFPWTDADKSWHPFAHCDISILPRSTIATRLLAGATFTDFDDIFSKKIGHEICWEAEIPAAVWVGAPKTGGGDIWGQKVVSNFTLPIGWSIDNLQPRLELMPSRSWLGLP